MKGEQFNGDVAVESLIEDAKIRHNVKYFELMKIFELGTEAFEPKQLSKYDHSEFIAYDQGK